MTINRTDEKQESSPSASDNGATADNDKTQGFNPLSADPNEVLGQLQGLLKNTNDLKDTLMTKTKIEDDSQHPDPPSPKADGRKNDQDKEDQGSGEKKTNSKLKEANEAPNKPTEEEVAAEVERQKLFHMCNSMNLYQKGHILAFLAREIVLQDVNSGTVLPVTACDIAIEGVSIVIRLPKKQDDGST